MQAAYLILVLHQSIIEVTCGELFLTETMLMLQTPAAAFHFDVVLLMQSSIPLLLDQLT